MTRIPASLLLSAFMLVAAGTAWKQDWDFALVRLNADGSVDTSFRPALPEWIYGTIIYGVTLQPDGKVVVGAWPSGGAIPTCVVRLNPDGSPDSSFHQGTCSIEGAWTMTRLTNGRTMVGGGFPDFNGLPTPYLACLHGDEALGPATVALTARFDGGLQLSWPSEAGSTYQLQSAASLPAAPWLDDGLPFPGTGGVLMTNLPIGTGPAKLFRLKITN